MANDNDDEVRAVWHGQPSERVRLTPQEIEQKVEQMQKKMRRTTLDLYVAFTLTAVTIVGVALFYQRPLLTAGAFLSLCGFAYVLFEVRANQRETPSVPPQAIASLDHQRALLQHRLDFHRKRLWWRVVALAPGGIVYFIGLAAALPRLAWLIYIELLTFVIGVSLIVPLNRKAAIRLQREIDELDQLRS